MKEADVIAIMTKTPERAAIIQSVATLGLPDTWIAGGFVRNTVWDTLFGTPDSTPVNDIDVAYFRSLDTYGMDRQALLQLISENLPNPVWDEEEEARAILAAQFPAYEFEVKNQARMYLSPARVALHEQPYGSLSEAVSGWVETATALGIQASGPDTYAILAPHGLDDLSAGIVRPTSAEPEFRAMTLKRMEKKGWTTLWPSIRFEEAHVRPRR